MGSQYYFLLSFQSLFIWQRKQIHILTSP
jgi:hypothetical protein